MQSLTGGGRELLRVIQVCQVGVEPVPQHAGRHHQWARTGTASCLVHTGDRAETSTGEGCLQRQAAVATGHPDPAGKGDSPRPLRSCPAHPALMSGEGTVPIRLNGRMIARTLPMMFSSGTVPWNSSPMWKRESAELPRLSPITQ